MREVLGMLCQQLPTHTCLGRMNGRVPGWAPVGLSACGEVSRSWARVQVALRRGGRRSGRGGSVEDAGLPAAWVQV